MQFFSSLSVEETRPENNSETTLIDLQKRKSSTKQNNSDSMNEWPGFLSTYLLFFVRLFGTEPFCLTTWVRSVRPPLIIKSIIVSTTSNRRKRRIDRLWVCAFFLPAFVCLFVCFYGLLSSVSLSCSFSVILTILFWLALCPGFIAALVYMFTFIPSRTRARRKKKKIDYVCLFVCCSELAFNRRPVNDKSNFVTHVSRFVRIRKMANATTTTKPQKEIHDFLWNGGGLNCDWLTTCFFCQDAATTTVLEIDHSNCCLMDSTNL